MGRLRSRKLTTSTGVTVDSVYCRKCMKNLLPKNFYSATDTFLDSNGLMSICSDCVDKIFENLLSATGSLELSVLKVCKMLNVIYIPEAIEAAKKDTETRTAKGNNPTKFFGKYKSRVSTFMRTGRGDYNSDLTYRDETPMPQVAETPIGEEDSPDFESLSEFWGTNSKSDIEFLEREMAKYRMGYVLDTPAQETLIKELCFLILQIDKDRRQDKSVEAKLKSLSSLMNSMGISPSMETALNAGKSESLGVRIKELEETSPADWYEDKSIYKDVDGIEAYIEKFITSPIRSFITGNKEFDIHEDGEDSDDDYDEASMDE